MASLPDLPTNQFLIIYSVQRQSRKAWLHLHFIMPGDESKCLPRKGRGEGGGGGGQGEGRRAGTEGGGQGGKGGGGGVLNESNNKSP